MAQSTVSGSYNIYIKLADSAECSTKPARANKESKSTYRHIMSRNIIAKIPEKKGRKRTNYSHCEEIVSLNPKDATVIHVCKSEKMSKTVPVLWVGSIVNSNKWKKM